MSSYEEVDNIQKRNSVLITPSFATSIPDRIFERNDRILKLRLHNSDEKRRLRVSLSFWMLSLQLSLMASGCFCLYHDATVGDKSSASYYCNTC